MEEEIWLPIEGYTGLYEVSSEGNVRSLNYHHTGRVQLLKPQMDGIGYLQVRLYKDGKGKLCLVHRLVAETFLPNAEGLAEVNHINECKTNNAVSNLEWCDRRYNCNHGTRNAKVAAAKSKPVQQFSKDGRLITTWPSISEAARQTGWSQGNICRCCRNEPHNKTAYGYKWQYA